MINYKKGDRIIWTGNGTANGKEFTCAGFSCCPNCGRPTTLIVEHALFCNATCTCGNVSYGVRENYASELFIKKPTLHDVVQYKATVSAPELLELGKLQQA